jgi:phage-related protein
LAIELATGYVSIVPSAKGFGRNLASELDGPVDGAASRAEGRFSGTFKKIALAAGALFTAKMGVDFLTGAITNASDLNETVSKSRAIFGDTSAGIEQWASGAAKAIGQSKQQALDAVSTFGNLFVQLGVGRDQAARMSMQMTSLASDFASFHNADITEVIEAQTAAFRGEYDALQRFVPTINAAAVEQKALAMTGKATTKELTLQEKALAVNALMMEGAGDAMGDFARTSDGLANKQRILAARMTDIKAKIGQVLLPAMTALAGFVIDRVLPAFERAGKFIGRVGSLIAAVWRDPDITSDGWVGVVETVVTALRRFYDFLQASILPVLRDHLRPILIGAAAAFLAVTSPIALVVAGLIAAWTQFEAFRKVVAAVASFLTGTVVPAVAAVADAVVDQLGKAVDWVKSVWPQISEAIGHVMTVVRTVVNTALAAVALAWRVFGDDLLRMVRTAWDFVRSTIANALAAVRGVIQTVLALINGDWGRAWDGLKQVVGAIWDQITSAVRTGAGLLRGAFGAVFDVIRRVGGEIIEEMVDLGRDMIAGMIRGVRAMAGRLVDAVQDVVSAPVKAAKRILGVSSPSKVFHSIGLSVGEGFILGVDAMANRTAAAVENLVAPPTARLGVMPAAAAIGAAPSIRVFIGDRELTDIVRVEIDEDRQELAYTARRGVRR